MPRLSRLIFARGLAYSGLLMIASSSTTLEKLLVSLGICFVFVGIVEAIVFSVSAEAGPTKAYLKDHIATLERKLDYYERYWTPKKPPTSK